MANQHSTHNKAASETGWIALCDVDQLDDRAIYHTELDAHELAVWRADDGIVNVWENRCPHRGVRLSIGHHRGDTLQCQYHGWQFGSGDGACRFVPAHPDAVAPPVNVRTWPVEVRYGFVWTCLTREETEPFAPIADLEEDEPQVRLRTVAIDAASESVQRALADYRFDHRQTDAGNSAECVAFDVAPQAVMVEQLDDASQRVVFLVQPARAGRTYLHGIAMGAVSDSLSVQRHHQQRLNSLRDASERDVAPVLEPAFGTSVAADKTTRKPQAASPGQPVYLQPSVARPVSALSDASATASTKVDRAFTVHLARSDKTVDVAADVSVLQSLREHGIEMPSSCEQGVCGTCRTRVLAGTPLHRDDFLTPRERAAGDCMLVCVSRALTDTLTLDL
ncbi:MAG TPA: Rieske 2Fe-2S domain-containing protein [Paraburkholderia sp.]|nr:Rieske 2Fe-2S domain-containing protein [Paraburkholderia sp.]